MEVYRLGPEEESQACFVGYLGCYVCDLLHVFNILDLSKSYNDFSFQKVHLFNKDNNINTAEKEPA